MKRRLLLAFITLPVVLATIVLGSYQLSLWVENRLGLGSSLLVELALTIFGFILALIIITKLAEWIVKSEFATKERV